MNRSLIAGILIVGGLGLWCPPLSAQSVVGPTTVKNTGSAVTVEAKYLGTGPVGAAEAIRFEIKLDIHSVNLGQYDLKRLASLRNDRGVAVKPLSFEKTGSGHHVQTILAFPAKDEAGERVMGDGTKAIDMNDGAAA